VHILYVIDGLDAGDGDLKRQNLALKECRIMEHRTPLGLKLKRTESNKEVPSLKL
jgi:hypothetical protein